MLVGLVLSLTEGENISIFLEPFPRGITTSSWKDLLVSSSDQDIQVRDAHSNVCKRTRATANLSASPGQFCISQWLWGGVFRWLCLISFFSFKAHMVAVINHLQLNPCPRRITSLSVRQSQKENGRIGYVRVCWLVCRLAHPLPQPSEVKILEELREIY